MSVTVAYDLPDRKMVVVAFTRNDDLTDAFRLAKTRIPQGWETRGRVAWMLWPIDEQYGDPLMNGYLFAQWGKRSYNAKVIR